MKPLTLRMKLRASHVKRWHIVDTTRQQSMAEHAFNVAMICEELMSIAGHWSTAFITIALHHDLPEVVTGDIPTPMKRHIHGFDEGSIDPLSTCNDDFANALLKLADIMDAITFLAAHGIGNHARVIRNGLIERGLGIIEGLDVKDECRAKIYDLFYDMCRWDTDKDQGKGMSWHIEG